MDYIVDYMKRSYGSNKGVSQEERKPRLLRRITSRINKAIDNTLSTISDH